MASLDIGSEILSNIVDRDGVDDLIEGNATATDPNEAQAVGVENGELGEAPNGFAVRLGGGNDTIDGTATAEAAVPDADGVRNDVDSLINTGSGDDTVRGTATAVSNEGGNGQEILVDGLENKGTVLTQDGNDFIEGVGTSIANGAPAIAGGIDNGRALLEQPDPFTPPVFRTGAGDDAIVAAADAVSVDGSAVTDAFSNVGVFSTGEGQDSIDAVATSNATGSSDEFRSVADAIDNRDRLTTGAQADRIKGEATAIGNGLFATANGIDNIASIRTGSDDDVVEVSANARATDNDSEAVGLFNQDGAVVALGEGNDTLDGSAEATAAGVPDADGILNDAGGRVTTGTGNDTVRGTASATSVTGGNGGEILVDGLENKGTFLTGDGNDLIEGLGTSTATGAQAIAGGIDNGRALLEQPDPFEPPVFRTGAGDDKVVAAADAVSTDGSAVTDAFSNVGVFSTGEGRDTIEALSTSEANGSGEEFRSVADAIDNRDRLTTGADEDLITATAEAVGNGLFATANGIDNIATIATGEADDVVELTATAQANGNDSEAAGLFNQDGAVVNLGSGNDTLVGDAEATAVGVPNADGLLNDAGGVVNAGDGNDTVRGTATVTSNEGGDGQEILVDGLENKGTFLTGDGNDLIEGLGTSTATGAQAIAGGIDNGRALLEQPDPFEPPVFETGDGDDRAVAVAEATSVDGSAVTDGFSNVGLFSFGEGRDTIEALSISEANGTGDEFRSVADAIDNRDLLTMGDDEDLIIATAEAVGNGLFASANGIDNIATIQTGDEDDVVELSATAQATGNDSEAAGLFNQDGAVVDLGEGNDILAGDAEATAVGIPNADGLLNDVGGLVDAGDGNDTVRGTATVTSNAGGEGQEILVDGLENKSTFLTGDGDDLIEGRGTSTAVGAQAIAGGIDNGRALLEQPDPFELPVFETGDGDDRAVAVAEATSVNGSAVTDGFSNVGVFSFGEGRDTIDALANSEATGTGDDFRSIADAIDNRDRLTTGDDEDVIKAEANAVGNGLFASANGIDNIATIATGDEDDVVELTATAQATDNNSEAVGLFNQDGAVVDLGEGRDTLIGSGEATAVGVPNADGILNDVGGLVDTGDDEDTVRGIATVTSEAGGEGQEILVDGLENKGTFLTGDDNDFIEGIGRSTATGAQAIAGGIDNGRALLEQPDPFEPPVFETGDGNDAVVAVAEATSVDGAAVTDGFSNVGIFDTGKGNDTLTAESISTSSGDPEAGRSIADAIDNRDRLTFGPGDDAILADAKVIGQGVFGSANGIDNIAAIATGKGSDRIEATALAEVVDNNADAVGIFNHDGATITTGASDDLIQGEATATNSGGDGLRTDVNGILNDVGSAIETGKGNDRLVGLATANFEGDGSITVTDGFENRNVLLTGDGADVIEASSTSTATGAQAIAAGFDNGVGGAILLPDGLPELPVLEMGNGNDQILASGSAEATDEAAVADGLENLGVIDTGNGNDLITAESSSTSTLAENADAPGEAISDGIDLREGATLLTGNGADQIAATATATGVGFAAIANAIDNNGEINTGRSNDLITATALATATDNDASAIGILNGPEGVINTEGGDDLIIAEASATADGETETFGIFGGTINTGAGNDQINASSFGGGVTINTGVGDDLVSGFGEATIDGGRGMDELAFEFSFDDFTTNGGIVSTGDTSLNEVSFELNNAVLQATQFERFTFGGNTLSFNDLVA